MLAYAQLQKTATVSQRPVAPRAEQHAFLTHTRAKAQDHSSLLDAAPDTFEPSKSEVR